MTNGGYRVFISAVTSEFGRARDEIAADLGARGIQVKVQKSFRQEPDSDTTLQKIHDYIKGCNAVICVVGKRSGNCPPPAAAAVFAKMLPPEFDRASYTQWEYFLARYYRKRLSIYIASDDYVPDKSSPTGENYSDLQRAFVRNIKDVLGLDRDTFSNFDQLCRAVLRQDWPKRQLKFRSSCLTLPSAVCSRAATSSCGSSGITSPPPTERRSWHYTD